MIDVLCVFFAVIFFIWYWKSCQHPSNFPPGPRLPLPLLGDAYILGDDLEKGFKNLVLKHGNISGFWLGPDRTVIVSDFELLQELLNKPETSSRQAWPVGSKYGKFIQSEVEIYSYICIMHLTTLYLVIKP